MSNRVGTYILKRENLDFVFNISVFKCAVRFLFKTTVFDIYKNPLRRFVKINGYNQRDGKIFKDTECDAILTK